MEGFDIKFQVGERVFSFAVGHRTKFFGQIPLMLLVEEWYSKGTVAFAEVLWSSDQNKNNQSNLTALLNGLEIRNIEEMLSKDPEDFLELGQKIRRVF